MHFRDRSTWLVAGGSVLLMLAMFWLVSAPPANAQCGSQASSCKNCHEVQGQLPVNGDGSAWHSSHAFGDFCYLCHAGNNQAKEVEAAHSGMVAPLADIQAACLQCHPADYQELAQVYATTLGVEIGAADMGHPPAEHPASDPPVVPPSAQAALCDPAISGLAIDDPNLVDYARRYDEIVLGKKPVNWGNLILLGMIGLVAVGGGGFVITRERLVKVAFGDTRQVEGEYPAEVVALLPQIAGLKAPSRKALQAVLANPKKAEKLLGLMQAVVTDEEESEA